MHNTLENGSLPEGEYSYNLSTSDMFAKVYGQISVKYIIKDRKVILKTIEPEETLLECASKLLEIYKGVVVVSPKDKFKIDLLSKLSDK